MGTLRRLDVLAVAASGQAAKELHTFLKLLREDVVDAIAGVTTIFHKNESTLEFDDNATDLPTALVLVNSLRALIVAHLASEGIEGAHRAASAETIAEPAATDQTSAEDLANELKADYNTHLTEAGVHVNNDSTNDVTSADATDLASLLTLVNEIKADYNAHVASVMQTPKIEA